MEDGLLDTIDGPADLKKLDRSQLEELAGEIRRRIIEVTSAHGGHLASSLGVVELTLALHRSFASPRDKIIWDVSHQAYAHKLLTGRNRDFTSLRSRGGICGFTRRDESEHDFIDAGHASTSISYALAFALSRDLRHEDYHVVAVTGDGALTGGLAYEGLNQTGHLKPRMIIILNDNGMSISHNVGAMSAYLSQLRLNPRYVHLKKDIKEILENVPLIGDKAGQMLHEVKERVKNFLIPEYIFEELGIKYVGPIDGHNIEAMERDLALAKEADGPVLLHVITEKGRGYGPAEDKPEAFHGTPPFLIENGHVEVKDVPSFTEAMGRTACNIARADKRLIAITAAMSLGTGLDRFEELYPRRFFDVGIAEQHAVTLAAGLALNGFRPLVAIYSTFLQRAYDQIIQEVCLQNLPVIFAIDRAGLVGEDGPTHHGSFDLSYLKPLPNLTIMAPKDQEELRDMLWHAMRLEGPVAIRYPRGTGTSRRVDDEYREITPGKVETIAGGTRVCLIGVGHMLPYAREAATIIEQRTGLPATVVNPRFVKPVDRESLAGLARSHQVMVTIEDNALQGGFGEEVATLVTEEQAGCILLRFGLPDCFVEHGKIVELHRGLDISGEGIAARALTALGEK
jgi:1-deoxy-D-xylulose-5-phosphate synthase